MLRLQALAALGLVLVAFAAACGGDEGTRGASPTSVAGTPAATTAAGTKTAPAGEQTPAGSPGGVTGGGTPRPTAPSGTTAVAPADQIAFLKTFADKTIDYAECRFDPATSGAECGDNGEYRVDPVPTGQDVNCRVGLVDGVPVLINCTTQDPAQSIYYEIKG